MSSSLVVPSWAWALLGGIVVIAVIIDLAAHRRGADTHRRAVVWSLAWVALSLAFGLFVALWFGGEAGEQWLSAYLLEKSLSVDNLFVFLLVFGALGIPHVHQHRVLTWGIFGAVATRAALIFAGVAAIHRWHALTYVFGAILVVAAVKLVRPSPPAADSRLVRWLQRHLPYTKAFAGSRFVTRERGRLVATPLLVAMIAIELTDVVFAIDSVPAAFAVTTEPFLIFSANLFALLGLRALYIVLARALADLRYLHYGLASVLAFAGAKLVLARWIEVPPLASIAIIAAPIAIAVVASLRANRRDRRERAPTSRESVTELTVTPRAWPAFAALAGVLVLAIALLALDCAIDVRALRDHTMHAEEVAAFAIGAVEVVAILVATALIAIVLHRALERQRRIARRHLALLARRQDEVEEFARRVAHDLRGPLSPIGGYANLIAMEHPEARPLCAKIERATARMSDLVTDLLELSLSGRPPIGEVPVATAVDDVLAELEVELGGADVSVAVPPVRVACSRGALAQMLANVVGNAAKYRADTRRLALDIRGELAGADLVLAVRDNGVGMSEDDVARAFEPLFRAPATAGLRDGTGLGLAIVERTIAALGGRCELASTAGIGTEVRLYLPVVVAESR